MTMTSRMLWIFGVSLVALFVLASGRTNLHNYQAIQSSIEEIYQDRLVVAGLIFDLSTMLHRKEIAQLTGDAGFYASENASVDARIQEHLERFRATRLTEAESRALSRFGSQIEDLQRAEREIRLAYGEPLDPQQARALAVHMGDLKAALQELSSIQQQEGRRRMDSAKRAESDMVLIAWVEAGLMIALAVVLTALFFIPTARRRSE